MDNYSSRRVSAQIIRPNQYGMMHAVDGLSIMLTAVTTYVEGVGYHVKFISSVPLGFVEITRNDGISTRGMFHCEGAMYHTSHIWYGNNPFMLHGDLYACDRVSRNFIYCKA